MTKAIFFGLAINYLSEDRNISIWEMWCNLRDMGNKSTALEYITNFFKNRALMLGCSFSEAEINEMTKEMWDVLTFDSENF